MQAAGMNGWETWPLAAGRMVPHLLWPTLAFVGALLVGALVIALLERWRKQPPKEVLTAGDQLTHFRNLYENGEISREEFERIRARLAGEMRRRLDLTPPADPPAPADPDGPEPPSAPRDGIRPA